MKNTLPCIYCPGLIYYRTLKMDIFYLYIIFSLAKFVL